MSNTVDNATIDQAFLNARTYNKFLDKDVSDELIGRLYDLIKWGPTSMNCQPGRYIVVKSPEAKERLKPALMPGNLEKTMAAPATVIVASDTQFYEHLPTQFPAMPNVKDMFASNEPLAQQTAFRNSSMQGAYLIVAARLLGLSCGPMSGFDNGAVDSEFFPDGRYQSNLLINIGFGDDSELYPRGPRLASDLAVDVL